jgi:hypothetical protein
MRPTEENQVEHADAVRWYEAEQDVLARAKAVAQQIAERCDQLTGGTQIDHRPLPPAPPGGTPPG